MRTIPVLRITMMLMMIVMMMSRRGPFLLRKTGKKKKINKDNKNNNNHSQNEAITDSEKGWAKITAVRDWDEGKDRSKD
jgi:hypothetical protein